MARAKPYPANSGIRRKADKRHVLEGRGVRERDILEENGPKARTKERPLTTLERLQRDRIPDSRNIQRKANMRSVLEPRGVRERDILEDNGPKALARAKLAKPDITKAQRAVLKRMLKG